MSPADLYQVLGPVNLNRLLAVYDLVDRPDLKYPPFTPGVPKQLVNMSLFEAISKRDILLHHPYESFAPVIDFIYRAANDLDVLAIKQTLYRTTPDSPLAESLVSAAKAGKEVTVLIELRARFDEAANIALASKLQEAGAHVVYGVVGYKTHCKMALVVRREAVGSSVTSTSVPAIPSANRALTPITDCCPPTRRSVKDHQVSAAHEGRHRSSLLSHHRSTCRSPARMIWRETRNASAGKTARSSRINALVEPEAARRSTRLRTGVAVDLTRGICCRRPPSNIRVRSIVGRFLEHSRCFCFHNGGDEEIYCASADWMDRNFFRRIELMFPIRDEALKARIRADLAVYLADNVQAWELHADGSYARFARQRDQEPNPAQTTRCGSSPVKYRAAIHGPNPRAANQSVLLQIRDGQRIEIEPAFREPHLERRRASSTIGGSSGAATGSAAPRASSTISEQDARHAFGTPSRTGRRACGGGRSRRRERLLEAHEPRHVRVGEQIAAVVVIARARWPTSWRRSPNEQLPVVLVVSSSSASPARAIAPPCFDRCA